VIALVAAVFWRLADGGPPPLTRTDVDRAVADALHRAAEEQRNAPPEAATVYRRILPSVVTVATGGTGSPGGGNAETSLGAGVVVDARARILTALHVVDVGSGPIRITFADGTQTTAGVVAREPATDIAVLAVDRSPAVTVPAVLGGGVQVGDTVYPVGHPLGLRGTLTAGVVSATDRSIRVTASRTLSRLIQFDAAVNPGSSGGPLLDRDGRVVGLVTALANPSEQPFFVGVGFAVPIAVAGAAAGGPQQ
jgi:S1-C subfamily serine protease